MASTEETNTAQSHTPRTPPLSAALGASTDANEAAASTEDLPPAEDGGLDLTMKKKKKKKVVDPDAAENGEAAADDGGLDLSMKKKKKKKPAKDDDFAAKLAALDLDKEGDGDANAEKGEEQSGDMEKGTGIWEHNETRPVNYDLLLGRFFSLLAQKNPDHAMSGSKSYKIPPPQCLREGNKVSMPKVVRFYLVTFTNNMQ